ncbi:hypothetical protein DRO33_03285 [Candidatus Bathyarchaeota archaeon]|nr:MAG: hypothetical protein DRO33_03285 [Candidatus Bathyarchaeota archaeon]
MGAIMITMSRRPTRIIRTFCNELAATLPGAVRVNRGKMSFEDIAEKAWEIGADRVILVTRWKGNPGKICLYKVGDEGLEAFPPLIYIYGIKLRRDMGIKLGKVKSLAVSARPERRRLGKALAEFLDVPFLEPGEEEGDFDVVLKVRPDELRYAVMSFFRPSDGREVGPRIRVRHLIWELE